MIQIETIKDVPDFIWNETSEKEQNLMPSKARQALIERSDEIKVFYFRDQPLLVAGLYKRTFLSIPYLWALIHKDFPKAPLSALRALVREAGKNLSFCETLVEELNDPADRLARLFKFIPTEEFALVGDTEYRVYRRLS